MSVLFLRCQNTQFQASNFIVLWLADIKSDKKYNKSAFYWIFRLLTVLDANKKAEFFICLQLLGELVSGIYVSYI